MKLPPTRSAFSLVEVVLALGVVGFALLAIIGLLPIALQSDRGSIQETRANHLADAVFAVIRSQPFTAVSFAQLRSTTAATDLSDPTAPPVELHATYEGNFTAAEDYFRVRVSFLNAPAGVVPGRASEVHVNITSRESGTKPLHYGTIVAAH
jgi:uncharacterized protein (TIGR02598 family)